MSIKQSRPDVGNLSRRFAHKSALRLKRLVQPLVRRRRQSGDRRVLEAYLGHATPSRLIVRGRILASPPKQRTPAKRRLANLRNMVALFLTDELVGVDVATSSARTHSDEEGYFQLSLPLPAANGWQEVEVTLGGTGQTGLCQALIPRADAAFMVISDIDDTVMQTGAYSLARNLWTTFTGSAATRHVFADAIALINTLSAEGRNPVYYVSSSPWNLHGFLEEVLWPAGLVKGPMFLRDLGLSETQFISAGHGDHKGRSIDLLLAANPDLPVILIGDTGQKDAQIYHNAVLRHPGRVHSVLLREAHKATADRSAVAALRATGTLVSVAPRFGPAALPSGMTEPSVGVSCWTSAHQEEQRMPDIENAKILIMATHGFEQSELKGPLDQLTQAGATVHVATPDGEAIKGWNGGDWGDTIGADLAIENIEVDDYIALVLPGGQINPDILRTNDKAVQTVRDFVAGNKIVAAICHAPWLLIEAGVVEGREMTAYPSIRTDLRNAGAKVVDKQVAISNGIITSRNPDDIDAFVAKIIEEVKEGEHKRDVAAE